MNKEIFLEHLPRWEKGFAVRVGVIKWGECNGYKVKGLYDDIKFEIEIIKYNKDTRKLIIKYKNKEYQLSTGELQKCSLGKILGKVTDEFKVEIGERIKDKKRDITIVDREYRYKYKKSGYTEKEKWYKYHCNVCGWTEGWIIESSLLGKRKTGCSCCYGRTVVEGINSIVDTSPWMLEYFQGGYEEAKLYTQTSEKSITPICPFCRRVKSKKLSILNIYRNHSIGCSCSDKQPYPEKIMFNVLEQLGLNFEYHKTFKWSKNVQVENIELCGNKEYDFAFKINDEYFVTETHGIQHYKESNRGRSLKIEEDNDKLKKELCLANGIKEDNYIVIDCRYSELELIKQNILKSNLTKLFDLSKIDWLKVEEFALSNLVKVACEYKRDNPDMTTGDIGKIMNLQAQTIRGYLIKGSKIWNWINYNGKEERSKIGSKNGISTGLPLIILKSNEYINISPSCAELARCSQELLSFKLSLAMVSYICLGKQEQTRGYVFKYIKDLTKEEYIKYDIENKLKELHNQELLQAI